MSTSPRHLLLIAAALALAACSDRTPTEVRSATPPRSVLLDATCAVGSFSTQFTPALTNQDASVTVGQEATYNCSVGASSASSAYTLTEPSYSCLALLQPSPPVSDVVTWTGGSGPATSTIHYTSVQSNVVAITFIGTVVAGRFEGDLATLVLTPTGQEGSNPSLCALGLGTVSRVTGLTTLAIVDTSL